MSGHEDRNRWLLELTEGLDPSVFMDAFYATMPATVFGLLVIVPVGFSIYSYTQSFLPVAVLLALFGGAVLMALPPQAALIASITVAIVLAVSLYTVWRER